MRAILPLGIVCRFEFGTHFALDYRASKATQLFPDDWSRYAARGAIAVLASTKLKA